MEDRNALDIPESREDFAEVLEVAALAGHVLLENGAEISRVEDIMSRIATHYGVDSGNFFVLSNGIFTTGSGGSRSSVMGKVGKAGGQARTYANVEFIPLRSIQLQKVVEVNRLSYAIAAGDCSLSQARSRLERIKDMPMKPAYERVLGSAFGAAGFCAVFGGGFLDCAADFVVGGILALYTILVSSRWLSKIVGDISNALVATVLCIAFYRLGFGASLGNIVIGAIMPLIPGVPFVNGVRDLANSDYLAGITRLTDAMLSFLCVALGVTFGFMLDGWMAGGLIELTGMASSEETEALLIQTLAAFVGTTAFAVLFGVPRNEYTICGVIGALGWAAYLVMARFGGAQAVIAVLLSTFIICVLSRLAAVWRKCPATLFLLCGIFPLVPGAGIFWFTYYTTTSQIGLALSTGFTAVKAAIAIVLGIVLAMELPQRLFSRRRGTSRGEVH